MSKSFGWEAVTAELAEAFAGGNARFAVWAVTGDGRKARMIFAVALAIFEIDFLFHAAQVEIGDDPLVHQQSQQRFESERKFTDSHSQLISFTNLRRLPFQSSSNGPFGIVAASNRQQRGGVDVLEVNRFFGMVPIRCWCLRNMGTIERGVVECLFDFVFITPEQRVDETHDSILLNRR